MGLYGERVGALHVVCSNKETAQKVLSQLKVIIRTNYSCSAIHGARIAEKILANEENMEQWIVELKEATSRISLMRRALRDALIQNNTRGNWDHITKQQGMFSFLGLTSAQCEQLVVKHHIYMPFNGRVCIAGLNIKNVSYVADCIKDVIENY